MKKGFLGLMCLTTVMYAAQEKQALLEKLVVARPYQDVIINGEVVYKGFSSTQYEKRLACVESVIRTCYGDQPITVLDIGAAQGFFDFRLGFKYPRSIFVMVDSGQSSMVQQHESVGVMLHLCKLNNKLNNIIFLNTGLTAASVAALGESEHFDVVLALNVIHHFVHDWKAAADAILSLGDTLVLEMPDWKPGYSEGKPLVVAGMNLTDINNYLKAHGARVIGTVDRLLPEQIGVLYLIEHKKHTNARGISVSTFEHYHGRYPEPARVRSLARKTRTSPDVIRLLGTAGVVKK